MYGDFIYAAYAYFCSGCHPFNGSSSDILFCKFWCLFRLNIFMGCIVFISLSESFLWKESSNTLINKTIKIHEKKYKTRSVP